MLKCSIFTLLCLLMVQATTQMAWADSRTVVGVVDKLVGTVKLYQNGGLRGRTLHEGNVKLQVKDSVQTKFNSRAHIRLADKSEIILTENSRIYFEGIKKVARPAGKVLFHIQKQGTLKGFEIATTTAVIGVKGTKFLVDNTDNKFKVYMNEGVVSLTSLKGKFKQFKKKTQDEFEAFRKKNMDDFKQYKKSMQKEFVEYVKSINVKAGQAVSLEGNELRNIETPPQIKALFKLFKTM